MPLSQPTVFPVKRYGASYASSSLIAAGGTSQVFSAAANVNGAVISFVNIITASAAINVVALLAKATAPASTIDGDSLAAVYCAAAGNGMVQLSAETIFVAKGLALNFFSLALETSAYRSVLYLFL